jgi:hypothetical protein
MIDQICETPAEERAVKRFLAANIRESMNRIEKHPPHGHQIRYLHEALEFWINRSDVSISALADGDDMLRDLALCCEYCFHFWGFEIDGQINKIFGYVYSDRSGEPAGDTPF